MASTPTLLVGRKRRRADKTPIEWANEKTDEEFIDDFLVVAWFSRWTHPKTKQNYGISLRSAGNMLPADLQACFSLVEETSKPDYEVSSDGWKPSAKKREMRSPELRYIMVKDAAGVIKGFTSLMPTYEQGQPVVYCYEIHLKDELRG
jgi:N-alpha-acetyltransferase 40